MYSTSTSVCDKDCMYDSFVYVTISLKSWAMIFVRLIFMEGQKRHTKCVQQNGNILTIYS